MDCRQGVWAITRELKVAAYNLITETHQMFALNSMHVKQTSRRLISNHIYVFKEPELLSRSISSSIVGERHLNYQRERTEASEEGVTKFWWTKPKDRRCRDRAQRATRPSPWGSMTHHSDEVSSGNSKWCIPEHFNWNRHFIVSGSLKSFLVTWFYFHFSFGAFLLIYLKQKLYCAILYLDNHYKRV